MPWLRLFRIALLPSAVSNILMGFLLAHQSWRPGIELILLILASASLYMAGMVLNDFFDYEVDLEQRPERPLPSNQISRRAAGLVGGVLLILGNSFAVLAGYFAGVEADAIGSVSVGPFLRSGGIAMTLTVLIVLYDGPLKRTILAPFLMGGCRSLNILLGASTWLAATSHAAQQEVQTIMGIPAIVWWVAAVIGVLIAGATLLGRNEAVEDQPKLPLFAGGTLILAGLIGLAMVVYGPTLVPIKPEYKTLFQLFVAIISITIVRRVYSAVTTAKPQQIQQAVVSVLKSLIIFDAGLCFIASPGQVVYAVTVACLLIPALLLSRRIATT